MGGHALKKCALRRFKHAEYKVLEAEAVARARRLFRRVHVPRYFDNKEDFGDVDILVVPDGSTMGRIDALLDWRGRNPDADVCQEAEKGTTSTLPSLAATDSVSPISHVETQKIRERLPAVFDSKEAAPNGPVLSLEFRGFQVDLIFVPEEKFDMARFALGYNVFGMILGMLCSSRGLKFGSDGLGAKVYYMPAIHSGVSTSDLQPLGTLEFSHDIYAVADFLGLPGGAARWEEGFSCLEDLYEYICGSRLMDPGLFLRSPTKNDNLDTRLASGGASGHDAFVDYVRRHHAEGGVASEGVNKGITGGDGDSSHCPAEVDGSKAGRDMKTQPEMKHWSFFYEALDTFNKREMFDNLIRSHERTEAVRARWRPGMMKSLLEAEQSRLQELGAPLDGPVGASQPQSKKRIGGVAGQLTGPEFGAMVAKFKRAMVLGQAGGGEGAVSGQKLSQEEESRFEDWVLSRAGGGAEVQRCLEEFLREEKLLQPAG